MKTIIQKLLSAYHLLVSPWLGSRCRFAPSCSEYAKQAYEQNNVMTATVMTAKRICRCHPWGGHGYDPVVKAPKTSPINSDSSEKTASLETK